MLKRAERRLLVQARKESREEIAAGDQRTEVDQLTVACGTLEGSKGT